MKHTVKVLTLLMCSIVTSSYADTNITNGAHKNSKRIEVYSLSQNYWDTQRGDTLSSIAQHLLPNNPTKREALQQDILAMNPQAFIDNNPEMLLADKRLWLPGYMKQPDTKANPNTTMVEEYSWGNIKRPRE